MGKVGQAAPGCQIGRSRCTPHTPHTPHPAPGACGSGGAEPRASGALPPALRALRAPGLPTGSSLASPKVGERELPKVNLLFSRQPPCFPIGGVCLSLFVANCCDFQADCVYCHLPHPERAVSLDKRSRELVAALAPRSLLALLLPLLRARVDAMADGGSAALWRARAFLLALEQAPVGQKDGWVGRFGDFVRTGESVHSEGMGSFGGICRLSVVGYSQAKTRIIALPS